MKQFKYTPYLLFLLMFISGNSIYGQGKIEKPQDKTIEFSKAGFLTVPNSGREVFDFNVGWRFYKGGVEGAHRVDFDDMKWNVVNCPHGLELLPEEASGCVNYQGEAWYRKHFTLADSLQNKQLRLHFEGVMGKCKVWLNGELVAEHFGGYLPFSADLSKKVRFGKENIIAVCADNSDDPLYPPGKPQKYLDFVYFGGIYRDVWLTATNEIFVTNPTDEEVDFGGGLLIRSENISEKSADVLISAHVRSKKERNGNISVDIRLIGQDGSLVARKKIKSSIGAQSTNRIAHKFVVKHPKLWSPQTPHLYRVEVRVNDSRNLTVDAVAQNMGIRKLEMRGKDGFWLNGKPYPKRLIGVNRHQDFAYIGNALPNNGQLRDAILLKNGGSDIVRAAHYPVDPSFMEACDALGMFYIVATPGWQFWNKEPIFEQRAYQDVKHMVRRDRNHPCVIMWEPILNESGYPESFAKNAHELVHKELPGGSVFTVCDNHVRGQEYFDVVYSHVFKGKWFQYPKVNTEENRNKMWMDYDNESRCVFTREFGDYPDDWEAHNSPSRIARNWGEHGQLVQVNHYENPDVACTGLEPLHQVPTQHIGGALWHAFDHQRGYHPDPFYGGLTDAFRQKKYAYHLFESMKDTSDPMIFIANEMTPMSESDINVLTNCEEVRLIVYETDTLYAKPDKNNMRMPHPVVRFKDIYKFMDVKLLYGKKQYDKASIIAEGLIDGKVVVRHKRMAAKRVAQIKLAPLDENVPLVANGSDIVVLTASVVDADGKVKRLANGTIKFEVEGNGELIGNVSNGGNPRKIEWGTAPILLRSSTKPGVIRVKASMIQNGLHIAEPGILEIETKPTVNAAIYDEEGKNSYGNALSGITSNEFISESEKDKRIKEQEKELIKLKLKEVGKQQDEYQAR